MLLYLPWGHRDCVGGAGHSPSSLHWEILAVSEESCSSAHPGPGKTLYTDLGVCKLSYPDPYILLPNVQDLRARPKGPSWRK